MQNKKKKRQVTSSQGLIEDVQNFTVWLQKTAWTTAGEYISVVLTWTNLYGVFYLLYTSINLALNELFWQIVTNTSAVSSTDWVVHTQLCKLRDTWGLFVLVD